MLMNYINIGISYLIAVMPLALLLFCLYGGIKFLIKREVEFRSFTIICEFAWILMVLSILKITGILGGNFSITSFSNADVHLSLNLFEGGISIATLLNVMLFIPFGFLSTMIFKKLREKWVYGIVIGLVFTILIEYLQSFTGRFVQLEDILMNTLGTYLGYSLGLYLLQLKIKSVAWITVSR